MLCTLSTNVSFHDVFVGSGAGFFGVFFGTRLKLEVVYIKFCLRSFVCPIAPTNYLSAVITSGDNRDAAYFELSKTFDSVPVVSLKKGGIYRLGG